MLLVSALSLFSCYRNVEDYLGSYQGTLIKDYNLGGPEYSNTSVLVDGRS